MTAELKGIHAKTFQDLDVIKDVLKLDEEKIAELEKENVELRNNGFTVSAMTEQQLKVALEKGEQLEKKNAELKERADKADLDSVLFFNQLCKAKEIIKKLYEVYYDPCVTEGDLKYRDELFAEIKQFLSEVEK